MAIHREQRYCPLCNEKIKEVHRKHDGNFVGDTFIRYEEHVCKPTPNSAQPVEGEKEDFVLVGEQKNGLQIWKKPNKEVGGFIYYTEENGAPLPALVDALISIECLEIILNDMKKTQTDQSVNESRLKNYHKIVSEAPQEIKDMVKNNLDELDKNNSEDVYRWVKASERLPDEGILLFIKGQKTYMIVGQYVGERNFNGMVYAPMFTDFSNNTKLNWDFSEIEWLEKINTK